MIHILIDERSKKAHDFCEGRRRRRQPWQRSTSCSTCAMVRCTASPTFIATVACFFMFAVSHHRFARARSSFSSSHRCVPTVYQRSQQGKSTFEPCPLPPRPPLPFSTLSPLLASQNASSEYWPALVDICTSPRAEAALAKHAVWRVLIDPLCVPFHWALAVRPSRIRTRDQALLNSQAPPLQALWWG
jgi:hypothetical protein